MTLLNKLFGFNVFWLLTSFLSVHAFVFAQKDEELKKYIPYENTSTETHPVLQIRTVIHVVQRYENDPQNLTLDSIGYIQQQFEWINSFYKNIGKPILPTADGLEHYIPDARVEFTIEKIAFHVDENDWDRIKTIVEFSPSSPLHVLAIDDLTNEIKIAGRWANRLRSYADSLKIINGGLNNGVYTLISAREENNFTYIKLNKKIVSQTELGQIGYYRESNRNCDMDLLDKYAEGDKYALHVFYTGSSKSSIAFGCGPTYNFLNISNILKGGGWAGAQLTAHELGHTLGLYHTDSPQFSDLPKTDKFGFIDCNTTLTSNNIMGYNKCRTYLSPMQIGYFHKLYNTTPDRIRITNANEYDSEKTIVVTEDTTWDKALLIRGNIIVKRNVTLVIEQPVHMAYLSTIYLEKKAKIIIKDADISNYFMTPWQGVVLVTDYNFRKKAPKKEKNKGKVVLSGKGMLRNVVIK